MANEPKKAFFHEKTTAELREIMDKAMKMNDSYHPTDRMAEHTLIVMAAINDRLVIIEDSLGLSDG